jgi:hypothetical protein
VGVSVLQEAMVAGNTISEVRRGMVSVNIRRYLARSFSLHAMIRLVRERDLQMKTYDTRTALAKTVGNKYDEETINLRKRVSHNFLGRCKSRRGWDCLTIRCTMRDCESSFWTGGDQHLRLS